MKKQAILLVTLLISTLNLLAQDKVTINQKEDFNKTEENVIVSTIVLSDFPNGLPIAAQQFLDNNAAFLTYKLEKNKIILSVNTDKNEKVVYMKFFYQLGIHEIHISKGKEKGIYTIEDFLNLYNL